VNAKVEAKKAKRARRAKKATFQAFFALLALFASLRVSLQEVDSVNASRHQPAEQKCS
jgi:hypothetical protein